MERKSNRLRAKLDRSELVTGAVVYSWSPNIMEVAGYAGLDFIRIDCEHAWRQDESAEHLMRAAALANVVPMMRVDRDNPYLIRKALEIGAGAVLVPDIHSAEEAEAVVAASKFPPVGNRGYSSVCWSAGWGTKGGKEWINWSNTEPMVGVMIEHVAAIERIDAIMAVPGLDYVLFGPADYSMSLGLEQPNKNHEDVQAALKKTVTAAGKYGKNVMLGVGTDLEEIKKYVDMGVTMLELSNDLAVLKSVWGKTNQAVLKLV